MKLILILGVIFSLSAFSQEDLIFNINCNSAEGVKKIETRIDLETGEETYFKQFSNGEIDLSVVHVEPDTEAMEVEGAIMEIFVLNEETMAYSRLSLTNPIPDMERGGLALDGILAYTVGEDIKEDKDLKCILSN